MDDYMRENCLVDFDGKEIDRSRAPSRDGSERGRSRHMSYQVRFIPFCTDLIFAWEVEWLEYDGFFGLDFSLKIRLILGEKSTF